MTVTTPKRNAGCRLWVAIRHFDVQQRLNCALPRHFFELRFPFGIQSLHGMPSYFQCCYSSRKDEKHILRALEFLELLST
jgi:hypothetical protein